MTNKRNRVDESSQPSEELQQRYTDAGFLNLEVNVKSSEDWYCLLHKTQGAAALPRILDGSLSHMIDSTRFEEDKLFCEWVYWIDWDCKTLTVSNGCEPAEKSFAELTEDWMESLEYSSEESEENEE